MCGRSERRQDRHLDDLRARRRDDHRRGHLHAAGCPRSSRRQCADRLARQRHRRASASPLRSPSSRSFGGDGHPGQYRAGIRADDGLSWRPGLLGFQLGRAGVGCGRDWVNGLSFIGPQFGWTWIRSSRWRLAASYLLTAVNAIGVRAAGGSSIVTVAIKVLPLLAVIWLVRANAAPAGLTIEPLAPVPVSLRQYCHRHRPHLLRADRI